MKRSLVSSVAPLLILAFTLMPGAESLGQQPADKPPSQAKELYQALLQAEGQHHALLQNLSLVALSNHNSGMTLAPADDAVRAQLKLPKNEGLIVTAVEPGSAADLAGIHQNDLLLGLGEDPERPSPVGKPQDLEERLKAAGEKPTSLVVLRGTGRLAIKVQPRISVSLGPLHPEPPAYWIGVSIGPVEPVLRSLLQIPEKQGWIVLDVVKDSPAAKAGLKRHDILLRYNGVDLAEHGTLAKLVQGGGMALARLDILREGKMQTIPITAERRKDSDATVIRLGQPETRRVNFYFADPAAVTRGQPPLILYDGKLVPDGGPSPAPAGADATINKRLDELARQIKELRQAIEALARAQEKK